MKLKNEDWENVKEIRMNFYDKKIYKGLVYFIYVYDNPRKRQNGELIDAGQLIKNCSHNVIAVNYKVFKKLDQDEFDALIKHEMLHNILNHKEGTCNEQQYIDVHKELWAHMTKKELIAELTLRCKF